VAQGVQGRKGERWGRTAGQTILQLQELRTMWLVWRLFRIGTGVCKYG
jgi:hypothetical protein